jgi:hypothetical protein
VVTIPELGGSCGFNTGIARLLRGATTSRPLLQQVECDATPRQHPDRKKANRKCQEFASSVNRKYRAKLVASAGKIARGSDEIGGNVRRRGLGWLGAAVAPAGCPECAPPCGPHQARWRTRWHGRDEVALETQGVPDLALEVSAAADQMASAVGQAADRQPPYGTIAPRQATDAVPAAPTSAPAPCCRRRGAKPVGHRWSHHH